MTRVSLIHKIYINTLFTTENYLKKNNKLRLNMSYYKLGNMSEKEILMKLENMTNIIKPKINKIQ